MTGIKQYASLLFKLAVAVVLIYWIQKKGFLDLRVFESLSVFSVLFCIGLIFINIILNNYRWTLLLNAQRFPVKTKETLPLSLIGLFFNFAMPGGVGGDVIKGYYLLQGQQDRKLDAAMSILVDRFIGLSTIAFMGLVAMAFHWDFLQDHPEILGVLWFLVVLFLGVFAFLRLAFSETVFGVLKSKLTWLPDFFWQIYEAFHSYRNMKRVLLNAVVISIVSQSFSILFFIYLNAQIGNGLISASQLLWIVPIGLISTSLPISPGGVGVGQAVFLVLFKWVLGQDSALGPNLITGYQISLLMIGMTGIYFYLRVRKKVNPIDKR